MPTARAAAPPLPPSTAVGSSSSRRAVQLRRGRGAQGWAATGAQPAAPHASSPCCACHGQPCPPPKCSGEPAHSPRQTRCSAPLPPGSSRERLGHALLIAADEVQERVQVLQPCGCTRRESRAGGAAGRA